MGGAAGLSIGTSKNWKHMRYQAKSYSYHPPPGLSAPEPRRPVIIAGAGPIGLAAAIELANHGVTTVVLDEGNSVSAGSRAICWSKRSLEIFDRLGVGDQLVGKGVTWKIGRTHYRDREIFNFDLLPEEGHKRPAFINLQQYYVEEYLIERASTIDLVELRFLNRVSGVEHCGDHIAATVETPDGQYRLECDYLLACDGVRSTVRSLLGLELEGDFFEERFLIADIEMEAEFPSERRFWFEPTFHPGQSALLHKQPDNIYRIDLQLGWDADPGEEQKPENVIPRIERVVGTSEFKIDWVSIYRFQCRRLASFVHGRVIFAGDSAHVVSPFGARGGNSGLQDVDSLCWRLAAVIQGRGPETILNCYDAERTYGADENIAASTRTTKFMTPTDGTERIFRDQLLRLADRAEFARAWVNSGRLSVPCVYPALGDDDDRLPPVTRPGSVAADAPQPDGWLIDMIGTKVYVLGIGTKAPVVPGAIALDLEINEAVRLRYLGSEKSAVYLIRPDQVVAARWVDTDADTLERAISDIWSCDMIPERDSVDFRTGKFDQAYDDILAAYADVGEGKGSDLSASLVISLCDQVGNLDTIREAIAVAKSSVRDN